MIGFIYKDFLILRKQMLYYLLFFVLYALLAVMGVFPATILSVMLVLIGMMLPMSSFSYDELARWDKYAAATPAGRRGMVAGKYLFALICILSGVGVTLLLQVGLSLTGLLRGPLDEQLMVLAANLGTVLAMDAIILPLLIKFGAEKVRSIYLLLFVTIFGGTLLLSRLAQTGHLPPSPPAWLLRALPLALALAAVGSFVLSYCIAQGIMARKEF